MAAVALTIDVNLTPKKASLPAELEARLSGPEPKSPEDLATALSASNARSASLRQLHLDNIIDRAARESARADEAKSRKLRLAAAHSERVLRRLDQASIKTDAKKEAAEADRMARKAKREEYARLVKESRAAAVEAKNARHAELSLAEALGCARASKVIADTKSKGSAAVQHAIAVAAAHKEKAALDAASVKEKLEHKLANAETRRELASASPASSLPCVCSSPKSKTPKNNGERLHRVLNESKVDAETKGKLLAASMAKADAKRAALLAEKAAKAEAVCAKAAAAVARSKAQSEGTDKESCEAKAALYDKLVRAESDRLFALKAKYGALHAADKSRTGALIVVDMTEGRSLRKPPAALSLRLASRGRGLLATASTRQAGALARRTQAKHAKLAALAKAAERRASVPARVAKALASKVRALHAKYEQKLINKALADGARAWKAGRLRAKADAAEHKRAKLAEALRASDLKARAKCLGAAERHAALRRVVAKKGVSAVRHAAFSSRKEAAWQAKLARGADLFIACAAAAAKRDALLAERVALAKKRMVATHPKREMADVSDAVVGEAAGAA